MRKIRYEGCKFVLELVVAKDINWNLDSSVSLPVAYVLLLHQELIMFLISV